MTDRELMQQALEALEFFWDNGYRNIAMKQKAAMDALRERLAQPEQEPVAWMYHGIRHDDTPHERPSLIWKPEYMDVMSAEKGAKATPLYTAPRQWQGLTQREIDELWDLHHDDYGNALSATGYERAIEAKLRAKNT